MSKTTTVLVLTTRDCVNCSIYGVFSNRLTAWYCAMALARKEEKRMNESFGNVWDRRWFMYDFKIEEYTLDEIDIKK